VTYFIHKIPSSVLNETEHFVQKIKKKKKRIAGYLIKANTFLPAFYSLPKNGTECGKCKLYLFGT
jgi:hypothetical protein